MSTFVKHPDTSEMLPAEASGRIRSGDQLVDINGHGVEGLNAEEATSLIRQVKEGVIGEHVMNHGPPCLCTAMSWFLSQIASPCYRIETTTIATSHLVKVFGASNQIATKQMTQKLFIPLRF